MKIIRRDSTLTQSDNIHFDMAVNCFVNCIESENCNFAHIDIRRSSAIEVSGCYIHDAFRSVIVPKSKYIIELKYESAGFNTGKTLSLIFNILVLLTLLVAIIMETKKKQ